MKVMTSPQATVNDNQETLDSHKMPPKSSNDDLKKENELLRAQLAETRQELHLLRQKVSGRKNTNETATTTRRRRKKGWNWMLGESPHELVSQQEEDGGLEIVATSDSGGLHKRRFHPDASPSTPNSITIHQESQDGVVRPFPLKAKVSDASLMEKGSAPNSPNRSDASDESLIHDQFMEECANIEEESFWKNLIDRSGWLVGLLILQSCSSFILSSNQGLLQAHLVLVQFLTMLVGAGGNAGNQASVRVIRGLAVGTVRNDNVKSFLWSEFRMGICLSLILGVVGCIRAAIFAVPLAETMAITSSLVLIVFISVAIGATLPLLMHLVKIDPAHSSTTIQVLMDILGVSITCLVSGALLNSSLGKFLSPDLYASSDTAANSL